MNQSIQKIIMIIFFSCFFWSCKKTAHDTRFDGSVKLKLSTEGLTYVQLNPNKFFIYKDSASGKTDSVIVSKSLLENIFSPAIVSGGLTYSAYNSEVFSLILTKIDLGIQTLWFSAISDPGLCCPSISQDNLPIAMHDSVISYFYYPVCNCDLSFAIPSITVEGKSYNNVIQTTADNGADAGSADYIKGVTYWAKGIGIIKRSRTTSSGTKTFTLLRNN